MGIDQEMDRAVLEWRRACSPDLPPRVEAIRRLVRIALSAKSDRNARNGPGPRMIGRGGARGSALLRDVSHVLQSRSPAKRTLAKGFAVSRMPAMMRLTQPTTRLRPRAIRNFGVRAAPFRGS